MLKIKKIQKEIELYKTEFIEKILKIYSDELLASLFFEVYEKINYIEDRCGVTRQIASTYLNRLVEAGLLEYEKVGRESIYKYKINKFVKRILKKLFHNRIITILFFFYIIFVIIISR